MFLPKLVEIHIRIWRSEAVPIHSLVNHGHLVRRNVEDFDNIATGRLGDGEHAERRRIVLAPAAPCVKYIFPIENKRRDRGKLRRSQ